MSNTDIISNSNIITRQLVAEHQRTHATADLFGVYFPLQLEPFIFSMASRLSEDYGGGYWDFYRLSGNNGFYMAPDSDGKFQVISENGWEGFMSADAFGITVCLFAYSNLSFGSGQFAEYLRAALPLATRVHDGPCRGRGDPGRDGLRGGAGARFRTGPSRFPCVSISPETPGSLPCMAIRETLRRFGKTWGRAGARGSRAEVAGGPNLSVSLLKPRPGATGHNRPVTFSRKRSFERQLRS